MLLWYRTLAYLALHREANLILSNGKVTALPTVFNPVVKLARTEAYRQERAASSTKLFTRQSSKLDKMHMEFGMSQEFIATYSQLQEASPKGGGRKRQASSRQCQEAALLYAAMRPAGHAGLVLTTKQGMLQGGQSISEKVCRCSLLLSTAN